jgi:hypothetical protein
MNDASLCKVYEGRGLELYKKRMIEYIGWFVLFQKVAKTKIQRQDKKESTEGTDTDIPSQKTSETKNQGRSEKRQTTTKKTQRANYTIGDLISIFLFCPFTSFLSIYRLIGSTYPSTTPPSFNVNDSISGNCSISPPVTAR